MDCLFFFEITKRKRDFEKIPFAFKRRRNRKIHSSWRRTRFRIRPVSSVDLILLPPTISQRPVVAVVLLCSCGVLGPADRDDRGIGVRRLRRRWTTVWAAPDVGLRTVRRVRIRHAVHASNPVVSENGFNERCFHIKSEREKKIGRERESRKHKDVPSRGRRIRKKDRNRQNYL